MEVTFRQKSLVVAQIFFGYAVYYVVRMAFQASTPQLVQHGVLSRGDVGAITTAFTVAYAVSRFAVGIASDNASPSLLLGTGLAASAAILLAMTLTQNAWALAAGMAALGLAQGCGWPAVVRIMGNWIPKRERATWWAITSASQNAGAAVAPAVFALGLAQAGGDPAAALRVPAVCGLASACLLWYCVVDAPPAPAKAVQLGAASENRAGRGGDARGPERDGAPIAPARGAPATTSSAASAAPQSPIASAARSPVLAAVCASSLALNLALVALRTWLPHLAADAGMPVAGVTAAFEGGAIVGSVLAGVVADAFFPSRRYAVVAGAGVLALLPMPLLATPTSPTHFTAAAAVAGAALFGAQSLQGVAAVDAVPSSAAGAATALIGLASKTGAVASAYPASVVATRFGWPAFVGVTGASIAMAVAATLVVPFLPPSKTKTD